MILFYDLPFWFTSMVSIIIGLMMGSFATALVYRLPREIKLLSRARSVCPKCEVQIKWYDNIPLIGYLLLLGKCRACKTKISIRYPIIETVTALLFLATALKFGWSWTLFLRDWPFVLMLVVCTFVDLEFRIIPDEMSLGGLAYGLATCYWATQISWDQALWGAGLGFGLFFSMAYLYHALKGQSGLGGGDIKLLAMMGAFLGPEGVFTTNIGQFNFRFHYWAFLWFDSRARKAWASGSSLRTFHGLGCTLLLFDWRFGLAPIHDTDLAKERWEKDDWKNFELWEKLEVRFRRYRMKWVIATVLVFLLISTIPVLKARTLKWNTLEASQVLARELNRLKKEAGGLSWSASDSFYGRCKNGVCG